MAKSLISTLPFYPPKVIVRDFRNGVSVLVEPYVV
jgi:hypothetical protein